LPSTKIQSANTESLSGSEIRCTISLLANEAQTGSLNTQLVIFTSTLLTNTRKISPSSKQLHALSQCQLSGKVFFHIKIIIKKGSYTSSALF